LNEWINRCSHLDVVSYHRGNASDLLLKRIEIRELYDKCSISKSKVDLLVRNDQLLDIATQLMVEGLKFSTYVEIFVFDLNYKYKSLNYNLEGFLEVYKELGQRERATQLANDDTKLRNAT